ncbi:MAG: response regulator transcription factor [Betaproteobacteria bacterium]|nr:response regulator transcription factor [Betaproteobacteria bacterium]
MAAHEAGGPLRVFIVDDEAPARARLRALLDDLAAQRPSVVVGEAENGAQALIGLAETPADVVLVDIRMPVMDGIELADHLQRLQPPPAVIFTTAYDQYAVRAFDLNAVDYLLKPVRAQRLLAALSRARAARPLDAALRQSLLPEGRTHLSCTERGRILVVPVEDILYLRAELKYVTARTAARDYLLEESLTALEQEYPRRFLRIHRNCLVARRAISGFERDAAGGEGHWLVLLDGTEEKLAVSRRQWPLVKAAMAQ